MNLVGNVLLMLVEFYLLNSDDDMNRSELLDSMLMRRFVNGSRSSQLNQRKKERKKKKTFHLLKFPPKMKKKKNFVRKKTMACIHKSSLSSSDRHFQPIRSIRLRARPKELKASLGRPLTTTKKKERKWPIKLATV